MNSISIKMVPQRELIFSKYEICDRPDRRISLWISSCSYVHKYSSINIAGFLGFLAQWYLCREEEGTVPMSRMSWCLVPSQISCSLCVPVDIGANPYSRCDQDLKRCHHLCRMQSPSFPFAISDECMCRVFALRVVGRYEMSPCRFFFFFPPPLSASFHALGR